MSKRKDIPGQINLFRVIWSHYPASYLGRCSCCGEKVAMLAGPYSTRDIWLDEDRRCSNCGAIFSEEDEDIPYDLPLLCGINNQPIVLTINYTGYTQEDIDKHGGIEWLKHRRCTEWFDEETTATIDRFIAERSGL